MDEGVAVLTRTLYTTILSGYNIVLSDSMNNGRTIAEHCYCQEVYSSNVTHTSLITQRIPLDIEVLKVTTPVETEAESYLHVLN